MPSIEDVRLQKEDDGWDRAFSMITLLWPNDEILEESEEEWNSDAEENDLIDRNRQFVESSRKDSAEEKDAKAMQFDTTKDPLQTLLLPLDISDSLLSTVSKWVRDCDMAEAGHEICRSNGHQRHLPLLRLIDVEKGCVISAPANPSYIALSYVWGKSPQARLLSNNICQLGEDDGFRKNGIEVSKTISDSMALCQRLGHRYLWVDALCILQDNPQDKILQLNTMRDIYNNAVLTIVAAEGAHANSGLCLI